MHVQCMFPFTPKKTFCPNLFLKTSGRKNLTDPHIKLSWMIPRVIRVVRLLFVIAIVICYSFCSAGWYHVSLVSFDCYSAIKMLRQHDCANVFTNNIQGFPLSLRWDSYFQFDVSLKKERILGFRSRGVWSWRKELKFCKHGKGGRCSISSAVLISSPTLGG